jgi:hypothetical protein
MVVGIILGAIIWLLFELNKGYKKEDFTYSKFVSLNWIPLLTNLICGLAILWFKEDINEFMPITRVYSVIIGLSGQAIFKKIVGVFDKNIETKIGVNKSR